MRWLPGLNTLRRYELPWLRQDLVAGLVMTTMLVPVGIAYAEASGVPGINGLYATIVPLLAYALFGPSRILVLGPDSALAPVILTVVLPLSSGDPQRAVAIAGMMAWEFTRMDGKVGLKRRLFMTFAAVAKLVSESWHRVHAICSRYVDLALVDDCALQLQRGAVLNQEFCARGDRHRRSHAVQGCVGGVRDRRQRIAIHQDHVRNLAGDNRPDLRIRIPRGSELDISGVSSEVVVAAPLERIHFLDSRPSKGAA